MDFALILFVLLLVTGGIWVFDILFLKKRRAADARDPWWIEYGAGFFPVILIVFLLRAFVVEPFRIPSASMVPTLHVGDFILVNKYTYGIRLPFLNKKIIETGTPQRGDVVVFRYPKNPDENYIKRLVGLPGDKVAYQNKRLTINGEEVPLSPLDDYLHPEKLYYSKQYEEKLGTAGHRILNDKEIPPFVTEGLPFPGREDCLYNNAGVICTVPPGHYFMMGDNRDHSSDSRVWGYVPDENIVGRAFFIWMNFSDPGRIGSFE